MGRQPDKTMRGTLPDALGSVREGPGVSLEEVRENLGPGSVRTLSKAERVAKYGEVFTPLHIVQKMCDALPIEAWEPGKTFLEPTCGEGVFVVEILRRKFENCRTRSDYTTALRSVYAMDILPDNVEKTIRNVEALCAEFFRPTKAELQIINDHVIQADSLKVMRMINQLNEWEDDK